MTRIWNSGGQPLVGQTVTMTALAAALGRGINFGNCLEAPLEGDWGPLFDDSWPAIVKAVGFTHVRLPVRFSNHAAVTADATLDPTFLARVDHVLTTILAQGLYVILDGLHHYRQMDGDATDVHETSVDPSVVNARGIAIWVQLGAHYAGWSNRLLYELHNEPHNLLDGSQSMPPTFDGAPWNALYPQLLAGVRSTDPTRAVLIGPANYNNGNFLPNLTPPTDPNVIITMHDYLPIEFTIDVPSTDWDGDPSSFTTMLDYGVAYRTAHGMPIYVGEFGSSTSASESLRVSWATMARNSMDARGMTSAVWNFDADFALYDTTAGAWDLQLLNAVIPTTHRNLRPAMGATPQIDTRHYSASQIRNMRAAFSAPAATPLKTTWAGLTNSSYGTLWGIDACDDSDQVLFPPPSNNYEEKGALHGVAQPANVGGGGYLGNAASTLLFTSADSMAYILSQMPTIVNNTNGSGTRFGYSTAKGAPSILRSTQVGDARLHAGLRSGLAYDGYPINNGEVHWIAFAHYLDSSWSAQALSSGIGNALWDSHSVPVSSGYTGTICAINWYDNLNGTSQPHKLWCWSVPNSGGYSQHFRYNWDANINGWQRIIIQYCSGAASDSPILNIWVANGTGSYTQLSAATDPYTGNVYPANHPFGDPIGGGVTTGMPDYFKLEQYNVGTPSTSPVSVWSTGAFSEKQVSGSLLAAAQSALLPWAL